MAIINILLVEDEEPSAVLITTLINKFTKRFTVKYHVTVSSTLEDAFEKIHSPDTSFDVILLDLCLPDSNGVDTFKKVYKSCPEIPIVIMTGYSNPDWELEAINSGAQDFLFKSNITGNSVLKSINKAIENKQLIKQISEDKKQIDEILNGVISDKIDEIIAYKNVKLKVDTNDYLVKDKLLDLKTLKKKLFEVYKETAKMSVTSRLDPLTGIPNRRLFDETFNIGIETATDLNLKTALMIIDLDNFKRINDFYGHDTGDKILKIVSEKIHNVLRERDFFARLGGDEFAIVLNNILDIQTIKATADRIIGKFKRHVAVDTKIIDVSLSIGISIFPDNGKTALDLFNTADVNLYQAKKINGSSYASTFFSNSLYGSNGYEFEIHKKVTENGNDLDFLYTEYQPYFRISDDLFEGVEVFSRIVIPDMVLSPRDFLPIVMKNNISIEFDLSVIKKFFLKFALWEKEISNLPTFSINICSASLQSQQFVDFIISKLEIFHLDKLILEVSETTFLNRNNKLLKDSFEKLKKLGVIFSVNNFGEGCTNFYNLKNINVGSIKISKKILNGIGKDFKDESFIKFMIQYAKSLDLKVYAESVETDEQKQFLLENGCSYYQGFLKCKPMNEKQLISFIKNYN